MWPVLFEIPLFGGIPIHTYGVLTALAFLTGILWTTREARIAGVTKETILDLSFYIVLAALIGSRLFYLISEWEHYQKNPLDMVKVWEGGLVFYGGLMGAAVASYLYLKKKRLSFLPIADFYMPGVSLGHAIGRLGCLTSGCCHGREAAGTWWAITFPDKPLSLAPPGIPLYPTQILESGLSLTIFFVLLWVRHKKRFVGQLFWAYLLLYGIARGLLEPLRDDQARTLLFGGVLSVSQLISVGLIAAAAVAMIWNLMGPRLKGEGA